MKKKIKIALVTIITALYLSGCIVAGFSGSNTVAGIGDMESYVFSVGVYSGIRVEGAVNVNYYSAPSNTVTLSVQPNLMEYFKIEVEGNDLVIRTTRGINPGSGKFPVLTISTPVLNRIDVSGACSFTTHDSITADSLTIILGGAGSGKVDMDVNALSVVISGAGKIDLSGNAENADFNFSGAGDLNALSLQTREASVIFTGAGSVKVHCTDYLRINANGAGSIQYRGSPQIDLNKSGVVSITKVD